MNFFKFPDLNIYPSIPKFFAHCKSISLSPIKLETISNANFKDLTDFLDEL
mgnify:CR=1 FL=1